MSLERFTLEPLKVKDAYLVTITEHSTEEGLFVDCFELLKSPPASQMPQITVSRSKKNVIRGMHCSPHHKLVQCPTGKAFDVLIDIRPDSPTFMQWDGRWIDKNHHMVIPGYCAHGFFSAEDDTAILYLQGGCFAPELDFSLLYSDPQIGIDWPKPIDSDDYIISPKDLNNPTMSLELTEKLRKTISNQEEARSKVPYTDFALSINNIEVALPFFESIQSESLKYHLLRGNGKFRETLQSEIYALRPKLGLISLINTKKSQSELFVEIFNIVHISHDLKVPLILIFDQHEFDGSKLIFELLKKEASNQLIITLNEKIDKNISNLIIQTFNSNKKGLLKLIDGNLI